MRSPPIDALRTVGRIDDATRLASRLGGAAHLYGHADELIEILTELWPNCSEVDAAADALVALALCADAARRNWVLREGARHSRRDATDPAVVGIASSCTARTHCLTMWTARLSDMDYRAANNQLQARKTSR